MPRVIVCDVNETLLDLHALEPQFTDAFGDAHVLEEWFANVLLYSEVATIAGPYVDFASVGGATLDMMAKGRGINLSADQKSGILQGMLRLPAHPDVEGALQMLRDAGLRLVTLTNSAPAAVQQQLTNSGLSHYFEQAFSVDPVRRFKPAPEVYTSVADALAIPVGELRLIAAHAWDIWGALRAGYAAAFVSRPGKALCPLAPKPDIVGSGLLDVARQIVAVETR
jgi:2-haloacid dehalogenase